MKSLLRLTAAVLILAACVYGFSEPTGKRSRSREYILYVGTYTISEKNTFTGSHGIYAFRIDENPEENPADKSPAKGLRVSALGVAAQTTNPSFLAADPTQHFLYAVNELTKYKGASTGSITAFAIDQKSARLTYLNEVPSRGADPCYISFDKTGKFALVANYTGGSVAVFPVLKDGHIGDATGFVQHQGKGVRPDRQEGPHAHWIETTANNRFAIASDLGLDELLVYRFDPVKGTLAPNDPGFVKLSPGTGPRHVAFTPDQKFVYSVDELNSTITAFSYDAVRGVLRSLDTVSTLPNGFSGNNDTAEIHVHPNGKFLFASNRGSDSIAVFAIDQRSGHLSLVDHFPTQGKTPRNFEIDPSGNFLLVANQDSDNIVIFRIDAKSGKLTPLDQTLSVPSPVSLRFVAATSNDNEHAGEVKRKQTQPRR